MASNYYVIDTEQLDSILKCPVCLEEYISDDIELIPYRLDCLHTFCLKCLKGLYVKQPLFCPECRRLCTKRIEELAKNREILFLIESKEKFKVSNKVKCKDCGHFFIPTNAQSDDYCADCCVFQYERLYNDVKEKLVQMDSNIQILDNNVSLYRERFNNSCSYVSGKIEDSFSDLITKINYQRQSLLKKLDEDAQNQNKAFNEIELDLEVFGMDLNKIKDEFKEFKNTKDIDKIFLSLFLVKLEKLYEKKDVIEKKVDLNNNKVLYDMDYHTGYTKNNPLGSYHITKLPSSNTVSISTANDMTSCVPCINYDMMFNNELFATCCNNFTGLRQAVVINSNTDETFIFATNIEKNEILKFKIDNKNETISLLEAYSNNGGFAEPAGITYNPLKNHIIISDSDNDCLKVFNENFIPIEKIGRSGRGDGCFRRPFGVFFHTFTQSLYVCDYSNNCIQVFDHLYKFLHKFGDETLLTKPTSICANKNMFYISDSHGVKVFKQVQNIYSLLQTHTMTLSEHTTLCCMFESGLCVTRPELNSITIFSSNDFKKRKYNTLKFQEPYHVAFNNLYLVVVYKNGLNIFQYSKNNARL